MPSGDLIDIVGAATDKRSSYRYDADRRRISERTVQAGALYQNNRRVYDALGQLTQITDTSAGRAQLSITYDAVGNRQRIVTDISANGNGTERYHSEGWYVYDAMNRQISEMAFVDHGYLGVQVERVQVWRSGQKRGVTHSFKVMLRRRSTIEPTIGI